MNSIVIVNDLHKYLSLLSGVEDFEREYYKGVEKAFLFSFFKDVSLEYNTITLKLKFRKKEEIASADYMRATFKIENQHVLFEAISCEYRERENAIRDFVQQHAPTTFPSPTSNDFLTKEAAQYLNIADEIARLACYRSSGDDYHPGFFSLVGFTDAGIALKQINHWNARSINHKTDYFLRNLEFYIPNETTEPILSYNQEKIGRMIVDFSDRSSKNNTACGDEILGKINEQKALFKNANDDR